MESTNKIGQIAEKLHEAVVALARRCDGARSEDRQGFNSGASAAKLFE